MQQLPTIGITLGDPAGIGPEIVAKALESPEICDVCRPVIIGRRMDFDAARNFVANKLPEVEIVEPLHEAIVVNAGQESAESGRLAAAAIEKSWDLIKSGKIDAVSTAPISKNALRLAGYDFPGHTEFFAHLSGTSHFAMSFFAGNLRVVLLSTHLPLRNALELVRRRPLAELIRFTDRELANLLGRRPRIAVAGVNPHASEGGLFGDEELAEIGPAIMECLGESIEVSGPFSPDTIFLRCSEGEFDAVIAMYHDQATIAVKSISFGDAVNVTLGLPFIRTSVDHGTAFDIAGKGIAKASSMRAAILLAAELVSGRQLNEGRNRFPEKNS